MGLPAELIDFLFYNRRTSRVYEVDLSPGDIDADNVMAHRGKASGADATDVSEAEYTDIHRITLQGNSYCPRPVDAVSYNQRL